MEHLQKSKAATQGWLTRVCSKMDKLLSQYPPATTSELIELMEAFDKRLAKLEEVQQEIEWRLEPDELEEYLDEADVYREKVRRSRRLCADRLKELTTASDVKSSPDSVSTQSVHAKLPKLELPKFNGDIT